MISFPETTYKDDIYITFNNIQYTWEEAWKNDLVFNAVFRWNGSDYERVNELVERNGYWIYARQSSLYISNMPNVLYARKVFINGTATFSCTTLIINPSFTTDIYCDRIEYQQVMFIYDEPGVLEEKP
jgi:hypothetical protein